jgi:Tfp pilus assembly protein PilE
MEHEPKRVTFTLKNLLAVVLIASLLLALLAPAIQAAREASRRNECAARVKTIGLGLQMHHDAFKRFPALSNQGDPAGSADVWHTAPGAVFSPNTRTPNGYTQSPASAAGYSWLVMILPYLEQQDLFDDIEAASQSFRYEAFSAMGVSGKPFSSTSSAGSHFATTQLDALVCPSFHGSTISTASSGTARPAVTIAAYAKLFNGTTRPAVGVAITNYVALSATHLACMGPGPVGANLWEPANGTIVPGKGLNMKAVLDGTSRTLIVCETKEPTVNSWYDGTVGWTVGTNPSASSQPIVDNLTNSWVFPPDTNHACGLNFGPGSDGQPLFAPHGTTAAQREPVSWGPSGDHSGGVVMHLACDASVHAITSDIDPPLYLRLITRAGREPVAICDSKD